jgi:hypothetical protein
LHILVLPYPEDIISLGDQMLGHMEKLAWEIGMDQ